MTLHEAMALPHRGPVVVSDKPGNPPGFLFLPVEAQLWPRKKFSK